MNMQYVSEIADGAISNDTVAVLDMIFLSLAEEDSGAGVVKYSSVDTLCVGMQEILAAVIKYIKGMRDSVSNDQYEKLVRGAVYADIMSDFTKERAHGEILLGAWQEWLEEYRKEITAEDGTT